MAKSHKTTKHTIGKSLSETGKLLQKQAESEIKASESETMPASHELIESSEDQARASEVLTFARQTYARFCQADDAKNNVASLVLYSVYSAHNVIVFSDGITVMTEYPKEERLAKTNWYNVILTELFGVNDTRGDHANALKNTLKQTLPAVREYIRKNWEITLDSDNNTVLILNPTTDKMETCSVKKLREYSKGPKLPSEGSKPRLKGSESTAGSEGTEDTAGVSSLKDITNDTLVDSMLKRIDTDYLMRNKDTLTKLLELCANTINRLENPTDDMIDHIKIMSVAVGLTGVHDEEEEQVIAPRRTTEQAANYNEA